MNTSFARLRGWLLREGEFVWGKHFNRQRFDVVLQTGNLWTGQSVDRPPLHCVQDTGNRLRHVTIYTNSPEALVVIGDRVT